MKIEQENSLKPKKDGCSISNQQIKYFDILTDEIEKLRLALAELKDKVDARDDIIITGDLTAENASIGENLSTKNLYVNGDISLQGNTTVDNLSVTGILDILGQLDVDLLNIKKLLTAKSADIEEADILSAIIDVLRIKNQIIRFDTNQEIISFPDENTTKLGDFANSIVLGGLVKPKWNNDNLVTDADLKKDYYSKKEVDENIDAETADAIRRETDIIKGNTPVQKVSAGTVDTDGNVLATSDDAFMLYGAQGRDNIPRDSSLTSLVTCGQYSAWKPDLANTITGKPNGETGPFDVIVGYSLTDKNYPYQVFIGVVKKSMYIRFYNGDLKEFDAWQQFQFLGGSTSRPIDVGTDDLYIRPEYMQEVNFYGNAGTNKVVFGARGNKKDVYEFGNNASSEVKAKKFTQDGKDIATLDSEGNVLSALTHKAILITGKNLKINELNNDAKVYGNIYTGLSSDWADPENLPPKAQGSHGFCLEILPNKSNTVHRYTVNVAKKMYVYTRVYDNKVWTDWEEVALLDKDGYVEKAQIAKNLEANAKLGDKYEVVGKRRKELYMSQNDKWYRIGKIKKNTATPDNFPIFLKITNNFQVGYPSDLTLFLGYNGIIQLTGSFVSYMGVSELRVTEDNFLDIKSTTTPNTYLLEIDNQYDFFNISNFGEIQADTIEGAKIIPIQKGMAINGVPVATTESTVDYANFLKTKTLGSSDDLDKIKISGVYSGSNCIHRPEGTNVGTVLHIDHGFGFASQLFISIGSANVQKKSYYRDERSYKWEEWIEIATVSTTQLQAYNQGITKEI